MRPRGGGRCLCSRTPLGQAHTRHALPGAQWRSTDGRAGPQLCGAACARAWRRGTPLLGGRRRGESARAELAAVPRWPAALSSHQGRGHCAVPSCWAAPSSTTARAELAAGAGRPHTCRRPAPPNATVDTTTYDTCDTNHSAGGADHPPAADQPPPTPRATPPTPFRQAAPPGPRRPPSAPRACAFARARHVPPHPLHCLHTTWLLAVGGPSPPPCAPLGAPSLWASRQPPQALTRPSARRSEAPTPCVCVCGRGRARYREGEGARERERERDAVCLVAPHQGCAAPPIGTAIVRASSPPWCGATLLARHMNAGAGQSPAPT